MVEVLWLCNVAIPKIAIDLGRKVYIGAGWLYRLADMFIGNNDFRLNICFPDLYTKTIIRGEISGVRYFAFPVKLLFGIVPKYEQNKRNIDFVSIFKEIISEVEPEILHIFGSEFPFTLSAVKAYGRNSRVVVHIQGLASICSMHYTAALPHRVLKKHCLINYLIGNIYSQKNNLSKRGESEKELLGLVGHVAGRTDWDRACTSLLSPYAEYHYCGEILRESFYNKEKWNIDRCTKFSIFFSQGSAPIKGLHIMLEAMTSILVEFPDAKLIISGSKPTQQDNLYNKLKISSYGEYLIKLIKEKDLFNYVQFTGELNEIEMHEHFLKCNVFVSASIIENSPNSVCEAQLLGVPIVASLAGGMQSLLTHSIDGYIYQFDAPYMMAYYIKEIFRNREIAHSFSENGMKRASRRHDRDRIFQNVLDMYTSIMEN